MVSILATFNHFLLLVLMGLFTYQLLDSSASSSIVVDLLNTNMNLDKVLLVLNVDVLCHCLLCGLCWRLGGTPSKVSVYVGIYVMTLCCNWF